MKDKPLKLLGFLLFIFMAVFLTLLAYVKATTFNAQSGKKDLPGLIGPVTVTRDQYGVPHIQAEKSDLDVFYALGYTHAQDRLWQMEFQRRVAQGSLSEVLGEAALDKDKFLRTIGFYRAAESAWPALDKHSQAVIRAYTQGINAFLEHGHLPLQFTLLHYRPNPWTNIDTIAWQKMMAWDLQSMWRQKVFNYAAMQEFGSAEISDIYPGYPLSMPTILSREDLVSSRILASTSRSSKPVNTSETEASVAMDSANAVQPQTGALNTLKKLVDIDTNIRQDLGQEELAGKGSNNWVLSGSRTVSGKPLLANDPHLSIQAPSLWYLVELKGPHIHSIGSTIPGLPIVVVGHNDSIAWGVTNLDPDTQDLYIESAKTPLKLIHEKIKVKGKPDVDWTVRESSHGPLISDVLSLTDKNMNIALKWTALLPHDTTMSSFIQLNYATNWKAFKNAMRDYVTPSQNFVYADIQGNIGYFAPGKIPVRKGYSGALPILPNSHHEWAGYIPFEKLPQAYNPQKGYIVTANNKATPETYPYSLTFRWRDPGFRSQRIIDLINQKPKLSAEDMARIQMDTVSYLWPQLKPILLNVSTTDPLARKALSNLENWDGDMSANSVPAAIFNQWFVLLHQRLVPTPRVDTAHTDPYFVIEQLQNKGKYCQLLGKASDCDTLLQLTLNETVKTLSSRFGSDIRKWQWGKIHQAQFNLLALGEVKSIGWIWNRHARTAGDNYTVNVGSYDMTTMKQRFGPSYREIIDMSNMNKSQYIHTLGQSGDPLSTHYSDFLPLWLHGKYITISANQADWGVTKKLILLPSESKG